MANKNLLDSINTFFMSSKISNLPCTIVCLVSYWDLCGNRSRTNNSKLHFAAKVFTQYILIYIVFHVSDHDDERTLKSRDVASNPQTGESEVDNLYY